MAEVRLSSSVTARYFEDLPDDGSEPAGAFTYYVDQGGRTAGMIYVCPCGCGQHGSLAFRPRQFPGASWEWDGNRERPTLTPSVHRVGHWHGWLRDGAWHQA